MGYELKPKSRSKKVKSILVGGFSWPIFLQETGAGYVIGYGAGLRPGSYVYLTGNNGSPVSNYGYVVNEDEAKMMAIVIRGYLSVQRFVNNDWDKLPELDRKDMENSRVPEFGGPLYRKYVHEDRLKEIEKIADFMERSKGFSIN